MKKTNIEIVQSYVLTSAKYDFSVYEKRILFRIIEHLQNELEGKALNERCVIQKNLFEDRKFIMPVSEFLNGENDKNYSRVKKALMDLRNKAFEYEDETRWEYLGIIEKPLVDKYKTTVEFTVTPKLYECFLNFAKGYKRYELTTAFQFESVYSMRFYELLSGQTTRLSYTIDALKEMFGLEDKYIGRPANFISRVVVVAQKELHMKSPYSFIYKTNRDLDGDRKIHTIHFYPIQTELAEEQRQLDKVKKKTSPMWELNRTLINHLREVYGFTTLDIKHNIDLLKWADEQFDIPNYLAERKRYILDNARSPVGYIVGSLKNEKKKFLTKSNGK